MKSRRISINEVVPGMVAASDVYSDNNQLIINKGTKLNGKIITRLKFYLIHDISVTEEEIDSQLSNASNEEFSYSEVIKNSIEFKKFNKSFLESSKNIKGDLNSIADDDMAMDCSRLLEYTSKIMSESRNGLHVFDMLHCMREFDDLTYIHALNVALISNVFGKWLKLPQSEIDVLTLSGLLHDIGKIKLPNSIINKQGPLTDSEYTIVKTHTVKGYQILKNKEIDQRIKYAALMHHERCDGSGYPNSFHNSNIDKFAKIVAIIDVYDAMTSARVYRPALSPFEAIKNFETEGLQKYDPYYIMTFLEGIIQSYVGNRVRLSNYLEGTIVMINKQALSKPIIKVGERFIDLSKKSNLVIQAIL